MKPLILATKLGIPPPPPRLIHRLQLIDTLEKGIPQYTLTHISAPAGYGKTTLLAQWARTSRVPVAWLQLDDEDNVVERLLRGLLLAWERVEPGVRSTSLGVMLEGIGPDQRAVLNAFIQQAAQRRDPLVFVLDDIHLIHETAVYQALAYLFDHLPAPCHFVLIGRGEPPLPLARYRARQQLLELGLEQLRFSPQEAAAFLEQVTGAQLEEEEAQRYNMQMEGWAAGLLLAGLSAQSRPEGTAQISAGGQQRFIAEYFAAEVLGSLPDDLQEILLETSLFERLSGALVEAVTGRSSGQAALERLERASLFLVPLDDRREWFRYHPLFADFLQGELQRRYPERSNELHQRAAHWFLEEDLPELAFEHAQAAGDAACVVKIFERHVTARLQSGELRLVRRWVEAIPAKWYHLYPVLGLAQVGVAFFSGDFETCIQRLDQIERQMEERQAEPDRENLARVKALRCFIACTQNDLPRAEDFAFQALQHLPEEDVGFRPSIFGALGDTYRQNGRWEEARQSYLKTLEYTHAPAFYSTSAHLYGALADLELRQGHLRSAADYWQQALEAVQGTENWGRLSLPVTGWVYTRLAELLYEWNELEECHEHLERGLQRAEAGGDVRTLIAAHVLAARLAMTEGDPEAAAQHLELAHPLVERASFPLWTGRYQRSRVELWLAQDQPAAARRWAVHELENLAPGGALDREDTRLAIARALQAASAPGSGADGRIGELLDGVLKTAQSEGRSGVVIEALALRALVRWQGSDLPGALVDVEAALRLAEPEGYTRLFADLGLPFARLLQEARMRGVLVKSIDRLLPAFGVSLSSVHPDESPLPERLTSREREVLELVAAGLTNREIAARLVISPETAKKHVANLIAKLGAGNRTEAVSRARQLDYLD